MKEIASLQQLQDMELKRQKFHEIIISMLDYLCLRMFCLTLSSSGVYVIFHCKIKSVEFARSLMSQ